MFFNIKMPTRLEDFYDGQIREKLMHMYFIMHLLQNFHLSQ